jgi:hypothetical protein
MAARRHGTDTAEEGSRFLARSNLVATFDGQEFSLFAAPTLSTFAKHLVREVVDG